MNRISKDIKRLFVFLIVCGLCFSLLPEIKVQAKASVLLTDEFGDNDAPFGDWSQTFDHSPNMTLIDETPEDHNGDVWKVQQGNAGENAYISYKTDQDISYFKVMVHEKSWASPTPLKYYVSPDNISYTEIEVKDCIIKDITFYQEPIGEIPSGMRYFKVEFAGPPNADWGGWNPRIGRVELYAGGIPEKEYPQPEPPKRDFPVLDAYRGVHPRLYMDADQQEKIKEGIAQGEPMYTAEWKVTKLHQEYAEKIIELAKQASVTGEPIMRYMEYEFPGEGLETVTDQFMLGSDLLVAPVLKKGAVSRQVKLPAGRWKYGKQVFTGPAAVTAEAPLGTLPVFQKL